MAARQRLFQNGRGQLATLIIFDVRVAWVAVALLPPGYLMVAVAPAVVVNALLISRWNGSQR
ncbi:hypothetical protein [Streptomyces sp. TRM68367]|uniref:hypothetical protein n=1 Tax=Streptomyces sp. TRM68367 TaxID=2758415 RepID=UPI00165AE420|nr:hypothetical protein [Streptomyces sp. TRM68367]MBC9730836.1 hypothetical protein [Streptomyces sp. TRM68367]